MSQIIDSRSSHASAAAPRSALITRRASLTALMAGVVLAASGRSAAQGNDAQGVDVTTFGADPTGVQDSTAAFTRAIAAGDVVFVPAGQFLVDTVQLRAGLTLRGTGPQSIVKQKSGARFALHCDSGSADPAKNLTNIVLRNLQLRGTCDTDGFKEHAHLVSANGVSHMRVDGVVFRGFRGDGFYLGSSSVGGNERHNRDVVLTACEFDGINQQNRNGVSIIDGDGVRIEGCQFTNTSRPDMPGAIDIEPDKNVFHVVRNIQVIGNRFRNIGGNVAAVSLFVPTVMTHPPSNIVVERNEFQDLNASAVSFIQVGLKAPGAATGFVMRSNVVMGKHSRPFMLQGVADVQIVDNKFYDSRVSGLVGYKEPGLGVQTVLIQRNVFERCGAAEGIGVAVFHARDVQFLENVWNDCGTGKSGSYAVDFNAGTSEKIVFKGNKITSATGKTLVAIQKEAAHRFNADSNVFEDNVIGSMPHFFEYRGKRAK